MVKRVRKNSGSFGGEMMSGDPREKDREGDSTVDQDSTVREIPVRRPQSGANTEDGAPSDDSFGEPSGGRVISGRDAATINTAPPPVDIIAGESGDLIIMPGESRDENVARLKARQTAGAQLEKKTGYKGGVGTTQAPTAAIKTQEEVLKEKIAQAKKELEAEGYEKIPGISRETYYRAIENDKAKVAWVKKDGSRGEHTVAIGSSHGEGENERYWLGSAIGWLVTKPTDSKNVDDIDNEKPTWENTRGFRGVFARGFADGRMEKKVGEKGTWQPLNYDDEHAFDDEVRVFKRQEDGKGRWEKKDDATSDAKKKTLDEPPRPTGEKWPMKNALDYIKTAWKRDVEKHTAEDGSITYFIREKTEWVKLEDEKRYKVWHEGKKGSASWEEDKEPPDFEDFKADIASATEAREEIRGRETETVPGLAAALSPFGERVGLTVLAEALTREGVARDKIKILTDALAFAHRGARLEPSVVTMLASLKGKENKDVSVIHIIQSTPQLLQKWQSEEDDYFIKDAVRQLSGGFWERLTGRKVHADTLKQALQEILASDVRDKDALNSFFRSRLGSGPNPSVIRTLTNETYKYLATHEEGSREWCILDCAKRYGAGENI